MKDFTKIILEHVSKYPIFHPTDAVKLIYQSEYGIGHLVADPQMFTDRLMNEFHSCKKNSDQPMIEDIGSGMCRVYLTALDEYGAKALAKLALDSVKLPSGDGFNAKLDMLKSLCKNRNLPFSVEELDNYLSNYGTPHAVSHSDAYRNAYAPAYRILPYNYALYLPLFARIERDMSEGKYISLAVDGMCGSGKSTLAALIERIYDVRAVHMDDFFLPPSLRTPERLSEPGGNVHYERFIEECTSGIKSGTSFSHKVFDCSCMDYNGRADFPASRFNLVEGTYSQHVNFGDIYTVRVFLHLPAEEQSDRILKRNGPAMHRNFVERWIPMENKYFDAYEIASSADFIFDTSI